jgi:hypothetical protein
MPCMPEPDGGEGGEGPPAAGQVRRQRELGLSAHVTASSRPDWSHCMRNEACYTASLQEGAQTQNDSESERVHDPQH